MNGKEIMKWSIKLEVLAKKDQNFVNGKCDFCGDEFASHILILCNDKRPTLGREIKEIKFCAECFKGLQKVVAADIIERYDQLLRTHKQLIADVEALTHF